MLFVISVLTARFLGAAGRGNFQMAVNTLGLYSPVFGSYSEYMPYGINRKKFAVQPVFSASLWMYIWLAGGLLLVGLVASPWLLRGFGPFDGMETQAVWIGLIVAPFAMFHVYITRLIWGLNEISWLNRLNTIQWILFIPALAIGVWLTPEGGDTTWNALVAWFLSYVITASISGFVAIKRAKVQLVPRFDKVISKDMLQFGTQMVGGNLVTQINYRLDFFLVFFAIGAAHSGVYSIAVSISEMLSYIASSVQQVMLTQVAGLEHEDSTRLTASTFRHTMLAILFSVIVMVTVMPWIMRFAYGSEYESAIPIMFVLLPGLALYGMALVLITFIVNQLGRPKMNMYFSMVSIVVNVGLSFWLLPRIGELGAAWAKTGAYATVFAISVLYFYRVTRYPIWRLFILQPAEWAQYGALFTQVGRTLRKRGVS